MKEQPMREAAAGGAGEVPGATRASSSSSSSSLRAEVVVAGGGLVGLACALGLAREGLRVVVLERAPRSSMSAASGCDNRTTAVAWGGRRFLASLGVWSGLEVQASPISHIAVTAAGAVLHFDSAELGLGPFGHIVDKEALRRALVVAAEGEGLIEIVMGARVASLAPCGDGIEALLDGGGSVKGRVAIVAEGRGSRLGALAGVGYRRRPYGQSALVFNVTHERCHEGWAWEHLCASGPLAFLPRHDGAGGVARSAVVWTLTEAVAQAFMKGDNKAELAAAAHEASGGVLGRLAVDGACSLWPLALEVATCCTAERLVLAGDSAHGLHPIAGQAFNLGLRDAMVFAKVAGEVARLGLDIGGKWCLERYARLRLVDHAALVAATDGLNRLFSDTPLFLRPLLGLALGFVQRTTPLRRFFMSYAMGAAEAVSASAVGTGRQASGGV